MRVPFRQTRHESWTGMHLVEAPAPVARGLGVRTVAADYLRTRLSTTPMMMKLGRVWVMIPIQMLRKRRVG